VRAYQREPTCRVPP